MNEVVVTGIGFTSCIGCDQSAVAESLKSLRHGFVYKRLPDVEGAPSLVYGEIDGFDVGSSNPLEWTLPTAEGFELPAEQLRSLPPHGTYAVYALEQAIRQAGLSTDQIASPSTGLFCASNGSPRTMHHHLTQLAASNWQRAHPLGVVSSVAGSLNFNLAARYSIQGASCGFVSACTSSSHALGYAFDEVATGRQERMLVVAGEDGNAESLLPFRGMRALSANPDPDSASRPFDKARDGFVGSGGSVAMILESKTVAMKRKATVLATMKGWAQTSDGYHIAAPHPLGEGLQRAMQLCLQIAATDPSEIDWISAHATSTPAGDRAEALALVAAGFGTERCDAKISSTKGITGHGLSHSGLLEAAICVLCIDQQIVPGNANLQSPDPACESLNLPTQTHSAKLRRVLNNSTGFGGSNVCHLFETPS